MLLFSSFCGCAPAAIARRMTSPAKGARRSTPGRYAKSGRSFDIRPPMEIEVKAKTDCLWVGRISLRRAEEKHGKSKSRAQGAADHFGSALASEEPAPSRSSA